jgi:hypothetical protein
VMVYSTSSTVRRYLQIAASFSVNRAIPRLFPGLVAE